MQMLAEVLAFVFVFVVLEVTALFAPHQLPMVGFALAVFLFLYSKLDRIEIALSEERRAQYQRFQERRREVIGATLLLTFVLCSVIYLLHLYGVIAPVPAPGEGVRLASESWGGKRSRGPAAGVSPSPVSAPAPPSSVTPSGPLPPPPEPEEEAPPVPPEPDSSPH